MPEPANPLHILVLCGRARKRSKTAEDLYKNDSRFHIRAAGVSPSADRKVSEKDLVWADAIFVMETEQRSKILKQYRHINLPPVEVLHISDDYERGDAELVQLLEDRMGTVLEQEWNF